MNIVFTKNRDEQIQKIDSAVEYVVDALSNSRDKQILMQVNKMPVLDIYSFRFYRRIYLDLKQVIATSQLLKHRCEEIGGEKLVV